MPQPPGNIIRSGQRCASYELSEVNMRHICPSLPDIWIVPNRDSKQRHLSDLNLNFLIKSQRWIREGHAGPRLWLKSFWLFTRHFTSSFFQLSWWDLSCDNYHQATDANSGSAKKWTQIIAAIKVPWSSIISLTRENQCQLWVMPNGSDFNHKITPFRQALMKY